MPSPQQQFRSLMGRFVTGITVIAAEGGGEVLAMTANSVTAVSLDPLVLLFCIRNESGLLPVLLERKQFSVNVLASGQDDVARHYGGRKGDVSPARWLKGGDGAPVLDGANACFVCTVSTAHRIGDHTVIYGAVADMRAPDKPEPALLYVSGRYLDVPFVA